MLSQTELWFNALVGQGCVADVPLRNRASASETTPDLRVDPGVVVNQEITTTIDGFRVGDWHLAAR